MHKKLLVFDIETVADTKAAANLLNIQGDSLYLREKLEEYHLEITGGKNSFIRQLFHRITAISFMEADIEYLDDKTERYYINELRSGGRNQSPEKELVEGFFHFFTQLKPRLVTFNGKTFDMPVLKYRAMKYGVQAKWLFSSGDKWSNYNSKYSNEWHCDLLEVLSDYGTSARIRMSEICALLNIPCKLDCDGSSVQQLFDDNLIDDIRDYCELDVVNTYLLYLRYQQFCGKVTTENYNIMLEELIAYLKSQQKQHFNKFLHVVSLQDLML